MCIVNAPNWKRMGEYGKKEEVTLQLCECPGLEKFQNFAINLMPDAQLPCPVDTLLCGIL